MKDSPNPLIPAPSPFFADKVVPVEPEEMEPFYERDGTILKHLDMIERLKLAKAEYDGIQDTTIKELQATISESLTIIGKMRVKVKAAQSRIATCMDKKKNAAHNFHITKHRRAIEQRKLEINKREAGKTARAMTNEILKKIKTKTVNNERGKIAPPTIPE